MDVTKLNNLNRVFRAREIGFVNRIKPTNDDFMEFNSNRASVRKHLRLNIKSYLEDHGISVTPKFRVQGSWAYGTCNTPALDGQEMDIDYGVYLPVSAFEGFNPLSTSTQAKDYFQQVEKLLEELCIEEGWVLDKSKDTCIRLKLRKGAHMDVPLYAVPDSMFDDLDERNGLILDSAQEQESAMHQFNSYHLSRQSMAFEAALKDENIQTIHMAKRSGDWTPSDCELIRKWFADQLAGFTDNGRQLRYICRYLKAWRDLSFVEGAPSSVLLMIIACKYYKFYDGRDDLALYEVLQHLSAALSCSVYENIPGHEEEDFNRMSVEARDEARKHANHLNIKFMSSLMSDTKAGALASMIEKLGRRVPNNEDLVELGKQSPFAVPSLRQERITSQPPIRQG